MESATASSATLAPTATLAPIDAGAGVVLHPATVADAGELYGLTNRNRARLRKWLYWAGLDYNLAETVKFLEERTQENVARQSLAMHIRAEGVLCGAVGIHRINPTHRNTSLGYWIDGDYEGRGIMTRACRAAVNEGFRGYGLHRMEIRCGTGNERSAAIPRRLGFTQEGIVREAEWVHNRWIDMFVFSMLEQDWLQK